MSSNMSKYIAEISKLSEEKLSPEELKKREEVATAIEKDNPDMPTDKKMAIATSVAKKTAEETEYEKEDGEEVDELDKKTLASYAKNAAFDLSVASADSVTNKDKKKVGDAVRRVSNREKGLSKAIDKLSNESVKKSFSQFINEQTSIINSNKHGE
jgi:hypothetical protein